MTKPLHIGRAAEAGMLAVDFAELGMDASADALDGRAGLLAALVGWRGAARVSLGLRRLMPRRNAP
jgi:2-methylcitrate dehydratase PrpD